MCIGGPKSVLARVLGGTNAETMYLGCSHASSPLLYLKTSLFCRRRGILYSGATYLASASANPYGYIAL